MPIHLVVAGYAILTTIEVVISKVVLESLQTLIQDTIAIIGIAALAIKKVDHDV